MRRVVGFRLRRGCNNLVPKTGWPAEVLPSMIGPSGFLVTDGRYATLDKSVSPLADCVWWDLERVCDHLVLQARCREQDYWGARGQSDGNGSTSGVLF